MGKVRFSFTRATVALIVALAAMLLIFARSDTAAAHTFNPIFGVSVSDPTPRANADIIVAFSANDSLPTDDPPTVLFIPAPPPPPKGWLISPTTDETIGAIGGTLDALATLSILGMTPCAFSITFNPTMYVASTDTSNPTSELDLEGHPGGVGYSGQFVPDPDDPDGLYGGITRYPDFLADLFPPEEVGEPLMRLWGGQNVLLAAVSMNILIFEPVQLPDDQDQGPPEWVYPVYMVLLNPVAPADPLTLTITSDLCTPLSAVSTQFGISKDNLNTAADEGGYVLLTNPTAVGDYEFTLKTTSMPDADYPPEAEHGDGLENILDTCPFDRNLGDSDVDGLDDACDPDRLNPSPINPFLGVYDEDLDNYPNLADNCPLVPNGIEIDPDSIEMKQVGEFVFPYAQYWDVIGPDNQADADGDDIGDACEGSEHGGPWSDAKQCANDLDDDADGAVNDGCPRVGDTGESGAECDNAIDDDADAVVNDGCPAVDPGDVAKSTPTGRIYTRTLTFPVPIYRHGVKLDDLECPDHVPSGGSAECTVTVENMSDIPEDIQVALRVVEGCATVNGDPDCQDEEIVSVPPGGSGTADFMVDWAGWPDGEYTVQADACHAGDPAPSGFFGVGACPGVWDGVLDSNPYDDGPWSMIVMVGSP